ncbi:MAG TPA: hypothetical protein VGJ53_06225 [Micromonosporaceae bacterium]
MVDRRRRRGAPRSPEPTATPTTLDEVAQLAGRLRTELRHLGVHAEVLRYCEQAG